PEPQHRHCRTRLYLGRGSACGRPPGPPVAEVPDVEGEPQGDDRHQQTGRRYSPNSPGTADQRYQTTAHTFQVDAQFSSRLIAAVRILVECVEPGAFQRARNWL